MTRLGPLGRMLKSRNAPFAGKAARAASTCIALACLVAAWALAAALVARPFLPSPWAAVSRLCVRASDGSLALHLGASARRVGIALAVAGPLGALLGLASGRSRRLDAFVSPFIYLLHPLPKVAFLPVIMLFLGLGDPAKVFLIGLVIFGQIVVAARDASRAVPEAAIDSLRSLGAGSLAVARHAILPASLPALLTALRTALGTSVAVLFIAESFASETGLGWYIVDAWTRVDYPDMYAAIVALALFGFLCYALVDLVEAVLCRWREVD